MKCFIALFVLIAFPVMAQQPDILNVMNATAGAQRLETRYLYAAGKWSDAGDSAAQLSAQIHCYQRFGLCEVAAAYSVYGKAQLNFDTFDILRWDKDELIAVDSSPDCIVNTLRVDFPDNKVSLNSASKGETTDICKAAVESTKDTVFMTGLNDELKRLDAKTTEKKK